MPTTQPVPEPRTHAGFATVASRAGTPRERLDGPGELIAYLPYAIGYHPAPDDVVFVAMRGNRLQGSAVVNAADDLAGLATSTHGIRTLWQEITAQLLHPAAGLLLPDQTDQTDQTDGADGADGAAGEDVAPAAPAQVAGAAPVRMPGQVLLVSYGSSRADTLALAVLGLDPQPGADGPELLDVLRVTGGRWRSLKCPGTGCCPPHGEPVPPATPATARAVLDGVRPRATREELGALLYPGPADLLAAVARRLPDQLPSCTDEASQPVRLISCRDARDALQKARTSGIIGPEAIAEAATMLLALENVLVRDQCLAWNGQEAGQLWRDLIRYAPSGWRAPVATVLGVYGYLSHDPALARTAFRHALADRPGYSLAHTMLEVMAIGTDPADFAELARYAAAEAAARADRLDARHEEPVDQSVDRPAVNGTAARNFNADRFEADSDGGR